jgi:hypothetical protein
MRADISCFLPSAWHPLRGPLVDFPLALCDAQTCDFQTDTMAGDVVDRDNVFENTQVHYNPAQRWYYLSNQLPTELVLFKNADSGEPDGATPGTDHGSHQHSLRERDPDHRTGVPHASFDNPLTKDSDIRRESLEMRLLVLW